VHILDGDEKSGTEYNIDLDDYPTTLLITIQNMHIRNRKRNGRGYLLSKQAKTRYFLIQ
jgi:hypothetical protein